jgi:hypothetical protein
MSTEFIHSGEDTIYFLVNVLLVWLLNTVEELEASSEKLDYILCNLVPFDVAKKSICFTCFFNTSTNFSNIIACKFTRKKNKFSIIT